MTNYTQFTAILLYPCLLLRISWNGALRHTELPVLCFIYFIACPATETFIGLTDKLCLLKRIVNNNAFNSTFYWTWPTTRSKVTVDSNHSAFLRSRFPVRPGTLILRNFNDVSNFSWHIRGNTGFLLLF